MITPENPFDTTIWDPVNPEHALEDPLHGPSAMHAMLEVPEMPDGNGTYYQAGLGPSGPDRFDAKGRPLIRVIGRPSDTSDCTWESLLYREWVKTAAEGDEALVALEARRQQERLDRTGVAHAFKPSDVCAGGKRLNACDTATAMVRAAQESVGSTERPKVPEGRRWNVLTWLGRSCTHCSLNCRVAYETQDGESTGIIRFSNIRPLEADLPVMRIDLLDK